MQCLETMRKRLQFYRLSGCFLLKMSHAVSKVSNGLATQDGTLTRLDIIAGYWVRDELELLPGIPVHILSVWLSFLTTCQVGSEQCPRVNLPTDPSRGCQLLIPWCQKFQHGASISKLSPRSPIFKGKGIRLCHLIEARIIMHLQRGKELMTATLEN